MNAKERLEKREEKLKIVVGIPTGTGRIWFKACNSILQAVADLSSQGMVQIDWRPGALLYKDRWEIMRDCYHSGVRYLLFLDDDMGVAPGQAVTLLKALRAGPWAVVSGMAPLRGIRTRFCISWKHPQTMLEKVEAFPGWDRLKANPVWPVHGFGMAFAFLDLERVKEALSVAARPWDPRDPWLNPFLPLPVTYEKDEEMVHGVLGEDMAFCHRVRLGGGKLAIHAEVQLGHLFTEFITCADVDAEIETQKLIEAEKTRNAHSLLVPEMRR